MQATMSHAAASVFQSPAPLVLPLLFIPAVGYPGGTGE